MEKYLYVLRVWSRNVHNCKSIHIIPIAREFVRLLPDVVNFALSFSEYEFVVLCFVGVFIYQILLHGLYCNLILK
jgi:hypothetical protein